MRKFSALAYKLLNVCVVYLLAHYWSVQSTPSSHADSLSVSFDTSLLVKKRHFSLQLNQLTMPLTKDNKILIKELRIHKGYNAYQLMQESVNQWRACVENAGGHFEHFLQ